MFKAIEAHFETYDRRIFWALFALLVSFTISYIYFLSISVFAVVERKHAEQESTMRSAHISELESRYVALDKTIDLALAHKRGFLDIDVPTYISRVDTPETLTMER